MELHCGEVVEKVVSLVRLYMYMLIVALPFSSYNVIGIVRLVFLYRVGTYILSSVFRSTRINNLFAHKLWFIDFIILSQTQWNMAKCKC